MLDMFLNFTGLLLKSISCGSQSGLLGIYTRWLHNVIMKKHGQDATIVGDEGGFTPNINVEI